MPERIPDETRNDIAAAIRSGGTCRGVARDFGVSTATVRKIASEQNIGDAFSREGTKNATRARVADLAARRAGLAEKMLDLAEHIAGRVRQPYKIYVAGPEGIEARTLEEPPLGEVRQAMTAVGIAVDKHIALVRFDTKEGGSHAATSLADRLAQALGLGSATPDGYDDGYIDPGSDEPASVPS